MKNIKVFIPDFIKSFVIKFFKKTTSNHIKFGRGVVINSNTSFSGFNRIHENSTIFDTKLGFYSYVGRNSTLSNVIVGNYCSIGPGVKIGLGKHPISDFVSCHPLFYSSSNHACGVSLLSSDRFKSTERITIGSDVWIGANVTVMDGVKIGHGAVLALGCVVTKDVEDFEIVGGVPAKRLGKRFSDLEQEFLLANKWWDEVDLSQNENRIDSMADIRLYSHTNNRSESG